MAVVVVVVVVASKAVVFLHFLAGRMSGTVWGICGVVVVVVVVAAVVAVHWAAFVEEEADRGEEDKACTEAKSCSILPVRAKVENRIGRMAVVVIVVAVVAVVATAHSRPYGWEASIAGVTVARDTVADRKTFSCISNKAVADSSVAAVPQYGPAPAAARERRTPAVAYEAVVVVGAVVAVAAVVTEDCRVFGWTAVVVVAVVVVGAEAVVVVVAVAVAVEGSTLFLRSFPRRSFPAGL